MGSAASLVESSLVSATSYDDVFERHIQMILKLCPTVSNTPSTEFMKELLTTNVPLYISITQILGVERLNAAASHDNVLLQSVNAGLTNVFDADSVNVLHIEEKSYCYQNTKEFMESHTLNTKSGVNAECQSLASIAFLDLYLKNPQFQLCAVNLANNQLQFESLHSSALKLSTNLHQLHLGGNRLGNLFNLQFCLPSSLVILDLSYTENLRIAKGTFLACPQLMQLNIDGCCIKSTAYAELPSGDGDNEEEQESDSEVGEGDAGLPGDGQNHEVFLDIAGSPLEIACGSSIFFGLVNLVTLSMRENQLRSAASLRGLQFFADSAVAGQSLIANDSSGTLLPHSLRNLYIAENPVCDVSAEFKKAVSYVSATVPSVIRIDGLVVAAAGGSGVSSSSSSIDRSSAAYRMQVQKHQQQCQASPGVGSTASSSVVVTDAMEAEFRAALRGDRDNTVVS
jgi:hypothetical protein